MSRLPPDEARRLLGLPVTRRRFIAGSAAAAAGLAAYGCVPGGPPSSPGGSTASSAPDRSTQAVVRIGYAGEEAGGVPNLRGTPSGGPTAGTCHAGLCGIDRNFGVVPLLAERLPSVDDGTWVLNSNGTMQVTWRLRRNAMWHDGRPFTSRDVKFSWEFNNDPSLPLVRNPIHTNVTAMDTPDDYTVVMHWSLLNKYANSITNSDMFVFPEHIVRPLWETRDPDQIFSQPFFQHQFVGLGPYTIEQWNIDDTIVLKAFPGYFMGPPRIGTIVIHRAESTLGLVTLLLSGTIQMNDAGNLGFTDGVTVQEQWDASGTGTVNNTPTGAERLLLPPDNPLFKDVRVRRAMLHAIDRDQLNATFFQGRAIVANHILHPKELGAEAAERTITRYPFDPRRALALFEEAGWRRGSDGVLTNSDGQRFEILYRALVDDAEQVRIQGAVADFWREVGVRATFDNVPTRVHRDPRTSGTYQGVTATHSGGTVAGLFRRWHSSYAPREETRFIGDNSARWSNPEADRLLEQLEGTIDQPETERLLGQFAKVFTDDLPTLPLFYNIDVVAIHQNLKNAWPRPNSSGPNSSIWGCYQWEWA